MSGAPRILLAGGGSGGSATPVIAVAECVRAIEPRAEMLLVGTRNGPEARLARAADIPFQAVPAGRLRRYWTIQNFLDPVLVGAGVVESVRIVARFRPRSALGAGGFASVPPLAAAALLGCPLHVHQQDALPGLANRLLIPLVTSCSVTLEASLPHFPRERTVLIGNPVRPSVLAGNVDRARAAFGLEPDLPVVLVTGGGTGALGLNRLVAAAAPRLIGHCQIIHLTGVGRSVPSQASKRYQQIEFVTAEMADLLAAADLVVSRAGMGILSELAALGKPTVLVPIPASHQAANASAFLARGAAVVFEQRKLTAEKLSAALLALLRSPQRLDELARNIRLVMPPDAADRLARTILALAS